MKHRMLQGWMALLSLILAAGLFPAQAQITETHTFTTNRVVPDGNAAGLMEERTIASDIANIASVKVRLQVTGEFNGDLFAYLRHGSGFTVLLNRTGRSLTNSAGYADSGLDVTFDANAANGDIHVYRETLTPSAGSPLTGIWEPDGRIADPSTVTNESPRTATLASFQGLNAAGAWTLYIADVESGGTNLLTGWELEITGGVYPTIAWSPTHITYGTALGSSQLNATASHASTNISGTFSYSPNTGTVLDSGDGQTLSVTFTPNDTNSFLSITTNVPLNVAKAAIFITANDASRRYGATNAPLTGTFTGTQNSDSLTQSYSTTATTNSPIGAYAIVPTAGGNRLTNYTVTIVQGTLTITNAPLTIAADSTSRSYGEANPSFSGAITGIQNNEVITATYATAATAVSPIGTYAIVPTPAGNTLTNYSVTLENGTLTVGQATLIVTANSTNRIFGASNPTFTGSLSGIVNSDAITASYASSANASSPVGTYDIVPTASGARLTNYAVTANNGVLTVSIASSSSSLASSANPALPGASVTFSLTVSAVAPATGTPTGNVQFTIAGSPAGSPVALSGGVATYSTSALSHGSHTVSATYLGSGNFNSSSASLSPSQIINTPPVAGTDTLERYPTQGVKVRLADLLANDTDADSDSLAINITTSVTTNRTVTVDGAWVFFTPASGFTSADSFTYTISDGHGATVTGTVNVIIKTDDSLTPNLTVASLGNGSFTITGTGIPGRTYRLQYTDSISPPSWQNVSGGSITVDALGSFSHTETPAGNLSQRYYRTVYP
jgi:subtilisin-like proprotein convertase family protein